MPTEWSCARMLPGNIGTKVKFQNPLSEDVNELNRKYDLFLFNFFSACSCMQIHFFLLHVSVCVRGSHRAINGKQGNTVSGELPFIKTSSRKCQIRRLKLD